MYSISNGLSFIFCWMLPTDLLRSRSRRGVRWQCGKISGLDKHKLHISHARSMAGRLSLETIMTASKSIHWLAPTTIISSLILGALSAVGHHIFYRSLEGTVAQDDNVNILGSRVSRQQLNIAGGTALAFLVKAALTTAVATAYIQLFWRAITRNARSASLETLDTVFSAFSNVFMLGKVWVWWRYPLLFSLAATAWSVVTTLYRCFKHTDAFAGWYLSHPSLHLLRFLSSTLLSYHPTPDCSTSRTSILSISTTSPA